MDWAKYAPLDQQRQPNVDPPTRLASTEANVVVQDPIGGTASPSSAWSFINAATELDGPCPERQHQQEGSTTPLNAS
jgi:hypothetical protein